MLVRSHGLRLVGDDTGSGKPIMFMHASPLNHRMWIPQVEYLEASWRCISFDVRGFGRSDLPIGISTMETLASDVVAVLDHLNINEAVFVGESMGGYIGMALLRRWPERVSAVVLAGTRSVADTPAIAAGREATAVQAETQGVASIKAAQLARLLGHNASDDLRQWVTDMIEEASPQGVAAALRGMALRPDSGDVLRALTKPALIITGEDDVITPPADARMMAGLIRGSTLHIVPGSGHLVNLEQPVAFNEALATFLKALP